MVFKMSGSLLRDGFAHHVWATQRLIDTCLELSLEQQETSVPGTYGSILQTMRHLVGADSWYLFDLTGDPAFRIEDEKMDLAELRSAMGDDGVAWAQLLARGPDPDAPVVEIDEESGARFSATMGIRLSQALHHGSDHRSQICTALTSLGVEPPAIDVWDFGETTGAVFDDPPKS